MRTANHEAAGGVDVDDGFFIQHLLRNDLLDDFFLESLDDIGVLDLRIMLGGDDDGMDSLGTAVRGIFDRDLGFAVGPEPINFLFQPELGKLVDYGPGVRDRHRHQLRSFRAGVAEHHALVAGALLAVEALVAGNAHVNVGRLLVDAGHDGAGFSVEAKFRIVVADPSHSVPGDLLEIERGFGGDLAGNDNESGGGHNFAGYAARFILTQRFVQNGVRDLVADFVRVSH